MNVTRLAGNLEGDALQEIQRILAVQQGVFAALRALHGPAAGPPPSDRPGPEP